MPTPNLPDRTARVRENKRRSRARHKEYVEDLERRWRESRETQLAATVEIQAAGRKVAEENRGLRALLKNLGIDDEVVEMWARGEAGLEVNRTCGGREVTCKKSSRRQDTSILEEEMPPTQERRPESLAAPPTPPPPPPPSGSCKGRSDDVFVPPCKVLTRLKLDPSTDPRDALDEVEDDKSADGDGVPCARAYKMLVPYAMTEEKMDALAERLEEGCVKDGKGGCKVKNEAVWKALDDICLE